MRKKYSAEEIVDIVNREVSCSQNPYRQRIVRCIGKVKGVFYSEIIAQRLLALEIDKRIEHIKKISRKKSYYVHQNGQIPRRKKNPREADFAKKLFNERRQISSLGKVIECQVPLKNTRDDGVGKIDLISIDNSGVLYLIELKYGKNREPLLRAVLEVATYYYQLDRDKLISDFSNEFPELSVNRIKKAVLLSAKTRAYQEATDLANRPHLNRLIEILEVQVVDADTFKKL